MVKFVGPFDAPDKYRLVELRSRGGEGEVWRGSLAVEGQDVPVAVKQILATNIDDLEQWRDRWRRQAEVLRSLQHPGLVTVREVFEGPEPHDSELADVNTSTLYLVMNWVEGPTLVEWVTRRAGRDVLESIAVVRGLASAVDYLHSGVATGAPIVHRDIKPANVIITDDGPRLVDFGFVRGLAEGDVSQTMVGTPAFIAPEVAAGLGATEASDRFALGATAYFALTGKTPDMSDPSSLRDHLAGVSGLEDRPDVHEHLLSMLHPDPTHRPASSLDWAQGLAQLSVGSLGGHTMVQGAPAPTAAPTEPTLAAAGDAGGKRGRKLVLVSLLAVAVIGGGLASVLVLQPGWLGLGADAQAAADIDEAADDPEPPAEDDPSPDDMIEDDVTEDVNIVLPDLVGRQEADARAEVEELGLQLTVLSDPSLEDAGTVTSQSPDAETELQAGDMVALTIAEAMAAPSLVDLDADEARALLQDAGVSVELEQRYDPSVEPGTVLEQSILPGTPLRSSATLVVAEGDASLFLQEIGAVSSTRFSLGQTIDMDGETYLRSLTSTLRMGITPRVEGSADFNLSRDFRRLSGTLGYSDTSPSAGRVRVQFFGDGEDLFTQDIALGTTVPIDLDVSGVLRLRITANLLEYSGSREHTVGLGEARLHGDPAAIRRYETDDG